MSATGPEPSAIELPPRNLTVTGAFNPDILVPAWVAKHLLVSAALADTFIHPVGGRVLHRAGELIWLPERGRLVVYGPPHLTSRFVDALASRLPHTPFSALGVNIQATGRLDLSSCREWGIRLDHDAITSLLGGETAEFTFSHRVIRSDAVRLTLKAVLPGDGPEAILDFNYHLQVSSIAPDDNERRAELVASHALRAEEFEADAQRICEVLLR